MKQIRLYENFHIVLWLMKDTCWLLHLKAAGTIMVFPTLLMALFITWKTYKDPVHFLPNVAVTCWISANITWMLGEFYTYDYQWPAGIFFGLGLAFISWYFVDFLRGKHPEEKSRAN